ncbi:MAG: hypothetical protein KDD58_07275 [Bdellovibrionales bacterium]|nr:hypothetical protein [Bdellovibrionales bacterium]
MKKYVYRTLTLILSALILINCDSKRDRVTVVQGGGEYGGGDAILEPATVDDVAGMVPKIRAVVPYNLKFLDMYLNASLEAIEKAKDSNGHSSSAEDTKTENSEETTERDKSVTLFEMPSVIDGKEIKIENYKNLKNILFPKDKSKKDVFQVFAELKIETPKDKPCVDASGVEKDGSIHSKTKGAICLSAYRLSKKLKRVHLFNSMLGLTLHELVHRMGGDKFETEAKIAEYITRYTPEAYSNLFFAYDFRDSVNELLEATSQLKDYLEGAKGFKQNIKDNKEALIKIESEIQKYQTELEDEKFNLAVLQSDLEQAQNCELKDELAVYIINLETQISISKITIESIETNIKNQNELLVLYQQAVENDKASNPYTFVCLEMSNLSTKISNVMNDYTKTMHLPLMTLNYNEMALPYTAFIQNIQIQFFCMGEIKLENEDFQGSDQTKLVDLIDSEGELPGVINSDRFQVYKVQGHNEEQLGKAINNIDQLAQEMKSSLNKLNLK